MAYGDVKIEDTGGGVWDIVLDPVTGDQVATEEGSVEDVAQRVIYTWMTWLGESPYQTSAGQPHADILGSSEPIEGIAALYALAAQTTPGVDELEGFDFAGPDAPDFVFYPTARIRVGRVTTGVTVGISE